MIMEDLKTYMQQGVATLSHNWRIAEKVGSYYFGHGWQYSSLGEHMYMI